MKHPRLTLIPAFVLLGAGCVATAPTVSSFEDCAAAGYPVMESYPRQCRTPDGRNFTEETAAPGPSLGMWAEPNGVAVSDQKPGSSASISAIIIEKDGWVVIHEEADGKPGAVVGEAYLAAGEHSGVAVTLREATVDGMGYYAMLHTDDGDRRFVIAQDPPVRSTVLDGIIMARFEASDEAGDLPIILP